MQQDLLPKIKSNKLMSKKQKKFCNTLNYVEYLTYFILSFSTDNGCVFISDFASLVGFLLGITSTAVGLKFRAIPAGIKKFKSIFKKKKKKHDKQVQLQ